MVSILLRNYYGNGGALYYGAGEILSAGNDVIADWSPYDDDCEVYGEDDEYQLIVIDLSYRWFDRINFLRVDFGGMATSGEEAEWDVMWMGIFRSADEAKAYTRSFLNLEAEEETKNEGGEATKEETDTEAPAQPETVKETDAATVTEAGNQSATEATTEAGKTKGCTSVIGGAAAILMTAAAASVALKKRR